MDYAAEIKRLEQLAREQDNAKRKAQSDAWKAIEKCASNWEWHSTPSKDRLACRVDKRVKPALVAEWRAGGFSTFSSDYQEEGRWFGMWYYRTEEGILTSDGGGHCVLNDPMLCNDAEWEEILAGNVPAKFKVARKSWMRFDY